MALRLILSLLAAAGAAWLTWWLGAPPQACWPVALITAGAFWLSEGDADHRALPTETEQTESFALALPMFEHILHAIEDPLLLVERQVVKLANGPAQALLGTHIVGQDVRLAIRHPAAAERLVLRSDAEAREMGSEALAPIQLVGLGEADRRWELTVHALGGDQRLVRLNDRTSSYAAERMRVDFVANASHELRTPLATIIGFIETLEDSPADIDPKTRNRFLTIMAGEARRMQRLVDDLISLSRIEAEKFSVPESDVRLKPLIEDVVSAAAAGFDESQRQRIDLAGLDDDLAVIGDPAQLSQLLHNLIGNALKYGRKETMIHIKVMPEPPNMIRITVEDQGDGIAPEHLPRLTERFYRVDAGRSRSMGGTGLGLSIVKHIVERHRGRLDISSVVGVGTTVSVLLPAARALS